MLVSSISYIDIANKNKSAHTTNRNAQMVNGFGQIQNSELVAPHNKNFATKLLNVVSSMFSKNKESHSTKPFSTIA